MTTPDLPADRPIPDTTDLRLLAELINNASIPLAYAAWNARMSQTEAAARLVSMAERGLPLRLVADGDRQALWHIAQAGPATSGVSVTGTGGTALPTGTPPGTPTGTPPVVVAGPGPVTLPPPAPVPPHEQAIAGAVPLGEPPFGQPESQAAVSEPAAPALPTTGPDAPAAPAGPDAPIGQDPGAHSTAVTAAPADPDQAASGPQSGWGPAGSASWARGDEAAPIEAAPIEAAIVPGDGHGPTPPRWQSISVSGPSGELLTVTILDVVDPGDRILTDAGFRMEPGQRAVLVHSSVQNGGQVHYYPVGDLYLVLETAEHQLLGRASVAVASHPAFPVGVATGRTADGWSVFLIPADTALAGLKWCIRPDFPQTIVGWPIAP